MSFQGGHQETGGLSSQSQPGTATSDSSKLASATGFEDQGVVASICTFSLINYESPVNSPKSFFMELGAVDLTLTLANGDIIFADNKDTPTKPKLLAVRLKEAFGEEADGHIKRAIKKLGNNVTVKMVLCTCFQRPDVEVEKVTEPIAELGFIPKQFCELYKVPAHLKNIEATNAPCYIIQFDYRKILADYVEKQGLDPQVEKNVTAAKIIFGGIGNQLTEKSLHLASSAISGELLFGDMFELVRAASCDQCREILVIGTNSGVPLLKALWDSQH